MVPDISCPHRPPTARTAASVSRSETADNFNETSSIDSSLQVVDRRFRHFNESEMSHYAIFGMPVQSERSVEPAFKDEWI
jgi:hypothetical protein